MRMNLMGVVYIMTCSFFSLDPHIDSVISPLGIPHMSALPLLLIWAIVSPYRSIPITSDLTCCVSNHAASFHQPQIYLSTAARSIYQIPVLSIFFFYQHGSKITRETRRGGRVADEGWWSFRGKLLRTVKPMNRRDK